MIKTSGTKNIKDNVVNEIRSYDEIKKERILEIVRLVVL